MSEQNPQETKDQKLNSALADQVIDNTSATQSLPTDSKQSKSRFRRLFTIKKILGIFGFIMLIFVLVLVLSRIGGEQSVSNRGDGEIVWWTIKENPETLRPLADEFERENPNIQIVIRPQSEIDYLERLRSALASNNPPEIFEVHKSWVPMFNSQRYLAPSTILSSEDFASNFYGILAQEMTSENGVQAMPLYYDAVAFYVNQEIFTRAAVSPPETWDELRDIAPNFVQRNNNLIIQSGIALGFAENIDYWQEVVGLLMAQNRVSFNNPDNSRTSGVINYFRSISSRNYWDSRLPTSTDFFAQGGLAMYFGPTIEASNIIQENPDLRFRTVLLPQIPKGAPEEPDFTYTTYYANIVSRASGDRDDAWRFLSYLSQEEQQVQINQLREERGLYPRIYTRPSMANLQNADPILGSVVSMIPNATGWYLNDDMIRGNNSLPDRISTLYQELITGDRNLRNARSATQSVFSEFGINFR